MKEKDLKKLYQIAELIGTISLEMTNFSNNNVRRFYSKVLESIQFEIYNVLIPYKLRKEINQERRRWRKNA